MTVHVRRTSIYRTWGCNDANDEQVDHQYDQDGEEAEEFDYNEYVYIVQKQSYLPSKQMTYSAISFSKSSAHSKFII